MQQHRRTVLALVLPILIECGVAMLPNVIEIPRMLFIALLIFIGMAIVVLPAWSEWPTLKRIRVRNPIVISAKDTVQIREAQANVGDSFGTGMSMDGGNTFSCGNKLNIVIRTIMEAKRITPAGKDIIVYITDELLNIINIEELHNILLKLQNDKRILTLKYFPDYLLPYAAVTKKAFNEGIMDVLEPSRKQFRVETNKKFIRLAKRLEVL